MVAAFDTAARIDRQGWRGKQPEPGPGLAGAGIFGIECVWRLDAAALRLAISLPLGACRQQLAVQLRRQRAGQHDHTVLAALGLTHDDEPAGKVDILDAQAHCLHQPHASAIKQLRQHSGDAIFHLGQHPGYLGLGHDRWNARLAGRPIDAIEPRKIDGQDLAVQKQNRAQGLVVGRGRHMALGSQHGQESLDAFCVDVARMPHLPAVVVTRPANEKSHPIQIHLLGREAIVHVANPLAHLVQQAGGQQRRGAGFHGSFITGGLSSIFTSKADCKPLSGVFDGQVIEHPPFYGAGFAPDITLGPAIQPASLLYPFNNRRGTPRRNEC